MSKHEEYKYTSEYHPTYSPSIPYTYAINGRNGYLPVEVIGVSGSFLWVRSKTNTMPVTVDAKRIHLVRKVTNGPRELYVSINKHTGSLDYMAYDKKDLLELDVDPSSIIKVREVPKE